MKDNKQNLIKILRFETWKPKEDIPNKESRDLGALERWLIAKTCP